MYFGYKNAPARISIFKNRSNVEEGAKRTDNLEFREGSIEGLQRSIDVSMSYCQQRVFRKDRVFSTLLPSTMYTLMDSWTASPEIGFY